MSEILQRPTLPAVVAEMARIRRAIDTSTVGDKEDLITYAKEVVRMRDAVQNTDDDLADLRQYAEFLEGRNWLQRLFNVGVQS